MAILANDFESLDKQFEIGIRDFREMSQQTTYNLRKEITDSILGFNIGNFGTIGELTGRVTDIVRGIMTLSRNVVNQLKSIMDLAINSILKSPFAKYVGIALGVLQSLDDVGVKKFFARELSMGSFAMCANLDTLENLTSGYPVPQNVLDGLVLSLLLEWMNRICKPFSAEEEAMATNRERLEMVSPYPGIELDHNNVMDELKGAMSGYFNNVPTRLRDIGFTEDQILESVKDNTFSNVFKVVEENKNPTLKREVLGVLGLGGDDPAFTDAINQLESIGNYPRDVVIKNTNLPRAKDSLGSYIKNLYQVDLSKVQTHSFSDLERDIFVKLVGLQQLSIESEFKTRGHNNNAFIDYDFDEVAKVFTDEEVRYLTSQPPSVNSWRHNGIHPTTEVFIEDHMPSARKRPTVRPGQSEQTHSKIPDIIIA